MRLSDHADDPEKLLVRAESRYQMPRVVSPYIAVAGAVASHPALMSEPMPEYTLKADYVLECKDQDADTILEEMNDALVAIAEKYGSYIGGGMNLSPYKDE